MIMVCLLRAPQLTVDWPLPTYLTPVAELGGLPKESGPQKSGLKAEVLISERRKRNLLSECRGNRCGA